MGLLLRFALAGLYITLGAMIFIYPDQTQNYVAARYAGLRQCTKTYQSYLPETLMSGLPAAVFHIIGPIFGLIGLLALFDLRRPFIVCSIFATTFGMAIHFPYKGLQAIEQSSQIRKLMFLFAVLCVTLAYPVSQPVEKKKAKKKQHSE